MQSCNQDLDNEGKKVSHLLYKDPKFAKAHFAETETEISARIKAFVERVKAIHPNDTLLVVTHSSPMIEMVNLVGEAKDKNMNLNNAEFRILKP